MARYFTLFELYFLVMLVESKVILEVFR